MLRMTSWPKLGSIVEKYKDKERRANAKVTWFILSMFVQSPLLIEFTGIVGVHNAADLLVAIGVFQCPHEFGNDTFGAHVVGLNDTVIERLLSDIIHMHQGRSLEALRINDNGNLFCLCELDGIHVHVANIPGPVAPQDDSLGTPLDGVFDVSGRKAWEQGKYGDIGFKAGAKPQWPVVSFFGILAEMNVDTDFTQKCPIDGTKGV